MRIRRAKIDGGRVRAAHRAVEDFISTWIGWSFPPALRAIEDAGWKPDDPVHYCHRCGESVGEGEADATGCAACRRSRPIADLVIRLGAFAPPLREWVHAAKYERWSEIAAALGRMLGEAVVDSGSIESKSAIVVPVPMPWQRRLYRGIDHARVIADAVAKTIGADPYSILAKSNGVPQTSLSSSARRRGRSGWIRARRRWGGWPLDGLDVILVDDVKTTGTTLKTAGRILKDLGAARVVAAVLAVADAPGRRPGAASQLSRTQGEPAISDSPVHDQQGSAAGDQQGETKVIPIAEVKPQRPDVEDESPAQSSRKAL